MKKVIFLAFVLRVIVWSILPHADLMPDERDFTSIADSIVHEHTFRSFNAGYHHARGPVYPIFLALAKQYRVAQLLVDSLTAGLLMLLGASLGLSWEAQLLAGILYAINPFTIYFSGLYLSETLFCFLLVLGFITESPIILGLLALTRTIGAGTAFILLWKYPKKLLVFFLVLSPWIVREYEVFGRFTLGPQGNTLWESLNPQANGGPGVTEIDDGTQSVRAISWALENPVRVAQLAVQKQLRFWSPVPNYKKFQKFPWYLIILYELPLLWAGVAGLFIARKELPGLFVVILMYPAVHLIILGSVRYRMPIEPFLCLLAAFFICYPSKEKSINENRG